MKKYFGLIVILFVVLTLNSFENLRHPETEILNKTLNMALQVQALPLISGVIGQSDDLHKNSAVLVKNGINYSYQIYNQLEKINHPQKLLDKTMRDVALGKVDEWEQDKPNHHRQAQRAILINQLHSGSGTALEYSKLIALPQSLMEPLLKDIPKTEYGFTKKIKVNCRQPLEKIAENIYQINGQQRLDFSVVVDPKLKEQKLAIFLENIPAENRQKIATLLVKENKALPQKVIKGKPATISYQTPAETFLTRFTVTDIDGSCRYLIKEVIHGQQKAIPFFWDGTQDGLALPSDKYVLKVEHFDQYNKLIEEQSIITFLTTEQKESPACFILEENDFSVMINNLSSGAFKLRVLPVSQLNGSPDEASLIFNLSRPSEKHSCVYFDRENSQIVVSVKDQNNQPIKEGFVKLSGDQGFNSSWQQTDHNGLAFFKYCPQENITAYLDLATINKQPLSIKKTP